MDKQLEPVVQSLQAEFGATVEEFRGEAHVFVPAARIIEALTALRDKHDFKLLSTMTAVDYWPQESPRFHVIYQLTSVSRIAAIQLRVPLNGDKPEVQTASGVFASANWRERELWDMFGITFNGHPDPRRILLPPDADFHPLRKDYPLGYEEPQFTFNYDEIDLRKPYAKE
jgi:NADH-quinone oxidoreductase subunit C